MRDLQCEYSTDVMSDITVRYFSNNPAVWAAITFHLAHMPPSIYTLSRLVPILLCSRTLFIVC